MTMPLRKLNKASFRGFICASLFLGSLYFYFFRQFFSLDDFESQENSYYPSPLVYL